MLFPFVSGDPHQGPHAVATSLALPQVYAMPVDRTITTHRELTGRPSEELLEAKWAGMKEFAAKKQL